MKQQNLLLMALFCLALLTGCRTAPKEPARVVFYVQSLPAGHVVNRRDIAIRTLDDGNAPRGSVTGKEITWLWLGKGTLRRGVSKSTPVKWSDFDNAFRKKIKESKQQSEARSKSVEKQQTKY